MNRFNAEVFVTVAKSGSYRKAADKLGYTQAGISYIIKSMEDDSGILFFKREFGGVKLTREGEAILPYMQKIYESEKAAENEIAKLKGLASGRVKLLSFNTMLVCRLPEILRGFREKYPGIEVEILSCEGYPQAVKMLQNDEADCGFVVAESSDEIELIHLRNEPDVAVIAENHPLADAEIFTDEAMQVYPFIGYPKDEAPSVYKKAKEKGINFNQIMTVSNDYGGFSMISQNLGFGIYPKMIAENCMFPVKILPIELGSYTPISIGYLSENSLSLAARAFVEYVIDPTNGLEL